MAGTRAAIAGVHREGGQEGWEGLTGSGVYSSGKVGSRILLEARSLNRDFGVWGGREKTPVGCKGRGPCALAPARAITAASADDSA